MTLLIPLIIVFVTINLLLGVIIMATIADLQTKAATADAKLDAILAAAQSIPQPIATQPQLDALGATLDSVNTKADAALAAIPQA